MRWAATKDWVAAREDVEDTAGRVWARVSGGEPPARTAERAGAVVGDKASSAAAGAAGAAQQVVTTAQQAAVRTKDAAQTKTVEAKEAAGSIWERGFRKGREVADRAKAAVGIAEDKVERKAAELADSASDVEKALRQRYEGRHDEVLGKNVEDILADRYKPVEQHDNSKLRGV